MPIEDSVGLDYQDVTNSLNFLRWQWQELSHAHERFYDIRNWDCVNLDGSGDDYLLGNHPSIGLPNACTFAEVA